MGLKKTLSVQVVIILFCSFCSLKASQTFPQSASENPRFCLFWDRSSDFDPTEAQLATSTILTCFAILVGYYMSELLWNLIWALWLERWLSLTVGTELFLSLYPVKAKWSVGWLVANVSKRSCQLLSCAPTTSIQCNTNNFEPIPSQTLPGLHLVDL